MKKLIIAAFALFVALVSNAQDILIMQNGDIIETKNIKVDQNQINYQLFDGSSDSVFVVKRVDAFMIKYANGTRDLLSKKEPEVVDEGANNDEVQQPIHKKGFLFRPELSGILVYNELIGKDIDNKASKDIDISFNVVYQQNYKISYGGGVSYNHTSSFGDFMPVYLNVRGYFFDKKITPYYDVRIGYAFCTKDKMLMSKTDNHNYYICEVKGFYLRGGLGLDINYFSFGLNVGFVGNSTRAYNYNSISDNYYLDAKEKLEFFFGVNIGYSIR